MRIKSALAALCALLPSLLQAADQPGGSKKFSCEYNVDKGRIVGAAAIEIREGRIEKIIYYNYYRGLPDKLGFGCAMPMNRHDGETKWKDQGSLISIEEPDSWTPSESHQLLVKTRKNGVLLDMSDLRNWGHCGAGASLPASVFVPYRGNICKVREHAINSGA